MTAATGAKAPPTGRLPVGVIPLNGLRLEYTTLLRNPSAADRDPDQRQFPASLALFQNASRPGPA
jgi:hypothetical protein